MQESAPDDAFDVAPSFLIPISSTPMPNLWRVSLRVTSGMLARTAPAMIVSIATTMSDSLVCITRCPEALDQRPRGQDGSAIEPHDIRRSASPTCAMDAWIASRSPEFA